MSSTPALAAPAANPFFRLAALTVLFAVLPAAAEEPVQRPYAPDGLHILAAEGRDLIALPSRASPAAAQLPAGPFVARSFEAASRRIHIVTFEGETFRAATPLDGPRSWVAFDPDRRAFASLLPSIRVELAAGLQLDAIAAELGATDVTVFDSLGFAVLDLPEDLHPADAVERVQALTGRPDASVRLRGPRIEWR